MTIIQNFVYIKESRWEKFDFSRELWAAAKPNALRNGSKFIRM